MQQKLYKTNTRITNYVRSAKSVRHNNISDKPKEGLLPQGRLGGGLLGFPTTRTSSPGLGEGKSRVGVAVEKVGKEGKEGGQRRREEVRKEVKDIE